MILKLSGKSILTFNPGVLWRVIIGRFRLFIRTIGGVFSWTPRKCQKGGRKVMIKIMSGYIIFNLLVNFTSIFIVSSVRMLNDEKFTIKYLQKGRWARRILGITITLVKLSSELFFETFMNLWRGLNLLLFTMEVTLIRDIG